MSFTLFEALFGSRARARLIRLFVLNPELEADAADISRRVLLARVELAREIQKLKSMGFLQEHSRKKVKSYTLNPRFPFFPELSSLVSKSNVNVPEQLFQKFRAVGDVKLVMVGGMLLNHPKGKADLVLVINNVSRKKLQAATSRLEAEVGREIRFVLMDTDELQYRLNMLDRFLIEIIEGPHQIVINRVPELKRFLAGLKK